MQSSRRGRASPHALAEAPEHTAWSRRAQPPVPASSAGCYPVGDHHGKIGMCSFFSIQCEDHLFITLPSSVCSRHSRAEPHHSPRNTVYAARVPQPALPLSPCASTDAPRQPQPATQRNGPYTAHTARTALHPAPPDLLDPKTYPKPRIWSSGLVRCACPCPRPFPCLFSCPCPAAVVPTIGWHLLDST